MQRIGGIVALVCGILAVVFGFVAAVVPWGVAQESTETTAYHAFSAALEGPARSTLHLAWSDAFLDGQSGIGMLRAGGPLLLAGTAFVLMAAVAVEHALWFKPRGAAWAAVTAAGISVVLVGLAVAMLPIGMQDNLDWDIRAGLTEAGTTLDWSGGLIVGILAAVFTLGTFAAALVGALRPES